MKKKAFNDPINWVHIFSIRNLLQMFAGVGLAVLAMRGFMIPNRFLDGGVTGISILLHEIYHWDISFLTLS